MPHSFSPNSSAEDRRNRTVERNGAAHHQSLIDELEASISQRNIGSRAEILRQITDLFVAGSGHFDGEQMALFDDVMNRLVNEIEHFGACDVWRDIGRRREIAAQSYPDARPR